MQTLSTRFATLAAAQQMGYFPNFDTQFFDSFKKVPKKYVRTTSEQTALKMADRLGKPTAAKKEGQNIFIIWTKNN
jgi:hypothetical protein